MEILIFSTVFYPLRGGIENLTLNLVREFMDKGHQVKVITYQKQPDNPLKDVEVYYSPSYSKVLELFLKCNVYYMPNISLKGIWPLLADPNKKWIISQNDFSLTNDKNVLSFIKLIMIKLTSKNISVSKSVAGSIKTNSEVVYNCYDDITFIKQNFKPRLLDFVFVGRLVSQKGCDTLIKACAGLGRPFKLTIVGDGPEMPKLKTLVTTLNLDAQITFVGTKSSVEIVEILNQHRIMVIPSNGKEGFGIVVLEGLACGCQVIATNSGGLAEAVGDFGQLFDSGNVQQLNYLLKEALQEGYSPVYSEQELNAYLDNYKTEIVAQKYLSIFDSVA